MLALLDVRPARVGACQFGAAGDRRAAVLVHDGGVVDNSGHMLADPKTKT